MNDLHFSSIKISGYRGRNFDLKMNPRGQHTVFIMDGNTGKTTTIELLRWCFIFQQDEAANNFQHMWNKPAHVLDDTKKSHQICDITIQFSAIDDTDHEHFFQLKRVTEGEFDYKHAPDEIGDKIASIRDTLEIDHGSRVLTGDDVFDYLRREFRFDECAEYFCFDGEKAREVMQMASDSGKIHRLLNLVNRRTTHPKLKSIIEKLDQLRERVLAEARAKITEKALQISMGKLRGKIRDMRQAEKDLTEIERQKDVCALALEREKADRQHIQEKITSAKAKNLIERNKHENRQKNIASKVHEERVSVYEDILKWVASVSFADVTSAVNQIKTQVKEKGKLPEPYRQDLIRNCIESGVCEICGRTLDEESEKRVKRLEHLMAPHEVQKFLSSDFSILTMTFDPQMQRDDIKQLIEDHQYLDTKIESIKLSDSDAQLVTDRNFLDSRIDDLTRKLAGLETDAEDLKLICRNLKKDVKDLQEKNIALKEYKSILDTIDVSLTIVDSAAEKIKLRATDILSKVISEGISSILGPDFSAKLSQIGGLVLGENGFYGKEKGGYSGRLILSYCFAEAMTLVDPIIVDTPVGNIGSQREALAAHLIANHKQVILLCLPTEINNFAHTISSIEPVEIKNLRQ